MKIVIDTSIIIAVITNESHKSQLITMTKGAELITPSSLHWEVGNAFSAMFKRGRITLKKANLALREYQKIPIQFHDIELEEALEISDKLNIYAYDSYFLVCAKRFKSPLLSLDKALIANAQKIGIKVQEVLP